MSYSKFRNRRTGGFHSQKEKDRAYELKLLERAGEIHDLKFQVPFELIETQREPSKIGPRGGVKLGKVIEESCAYIADFTYFTKDGRYIVEDSKGVKTKEYIIKRKLMLKLYGVRVYET